MNEVQVQSTPNGIVFHPHPERKNFQDLTGMVFGKLTVLGYAPPKLLKTNSTPVFHWWCRCECGVIKPVQGSGMKYGNVRSCGCTSRFKRTHGMCKTTEYRAWASMLDRCSESNRKYHVRYAGRGIKVCARWIESFENFLEDMGPKPFNNYSIDRIDNDGNYEPGNCRWTDMTTQCRNRSNNRMLTHNGQTRCLSEWSVLNGIPENALRARLSSGWPVDKALETPPKKDKRRQNATH